jgi:hypothetical protein
VLDTVQEIQERHSAVKDLERQLLGLHQIFLDMAVLVEAQGEMLDNIETQESCTGAAPFLVLTLPGIPGCKSERVRQPGQQGLDQRQGAPEGHEEVDVLRNDAPALHLPHRRARCGQAVEGAISDVRGHTEHALTQAYLLQNGIA